MEGALPLFDLDHPTFDHELVRLASSDLVGAGVPSKRGQSTKNRLLDTCADTGTCRATDVTEARSYLVVADISLAVGVIAAAAGVYFLVR